MKKSYLALIILSIILVTCTQQDVHLLSDSDKTNQPTPFQPFLPTLTPTLKRYIVQNALIPSAGIQASSGQINILLLGSDYRVNQGSRTDIILGISLFTKEKKSV